MDAEGNKVKVKKEHSGACCLRASPAGRPARLARRVLFVASLPLRSFLVRSPNTLGCTRWLCQKSVRSASLISHHDIAILSRADLAKAKAKLAAKNKTVKAAEMGDPLAQALLEQVGCSLQTTWTLPF